MSLGFTRREALGILGAAWVLGPRLSQGAEAALGTEIKASSTLSLPVDVRRPKPPVVTGVALSLDGLMAAAVGDDHVVRLWKLDENRIVRELKGHEDWIRAAAFHPHGAWLATAGDDRTVRMWDTTTGQMIRRLPDEPQAIRSLAIAPDGATIATAGFDSQARFYNPEEGKLIRELSCPSEDMRVLRFSPDGKHLAGGGRNGKLRLWDLVADTTHADVEAHESRIRAIEFSRDGSKLATAGEGQHLNIFDVATMTAETTYAIRPGKAMSLAWCGDERLAVGLSTNLIRIYERHSDLPTMRLVGHEGTVATLVWNADTQQLVSGSFDTTVRIWALDKHGVPKTARKPG